MQYWKCHPARSSICSVNTAGLIYIWATVTTEKWGAFAANFEELDENVVYEEREDEFDIVSQKTPNAVIPTYRSGCQEDEEVLKKRKQDQEELDVDVTGVDDEPEPITNALFEISNGPNDPIASTVQWLMEDPDDDTVQDYFPDRKSVV